MSSTDFAKTDFEMIDADIHVMEPASSWKYVDKEFRDRIQVKQMIEDPLWREGIYDLTIDGLPIPRWIKPGDRDARFRGLHESVKKKFPEGKSGWDPDQYVRDITTMGFSQVVIYPTMWLWAIGMPQIGAKFSAALARAYNDWLFDFCSVAPKRMRPVAALSLHSVDDAIAEARRCSAKGFVGVFVRPNPTYGRPIGHPDNHPLFKELQELDLALGLHEGGMSYLPILGEDRTRAQWGIHAMSHAFEQMAAMISILEHRVYDLCPKLRVLYLEAGSALWVPYWLDRLDEEMELTYRVGDAMELKPSEYFARQAFATFEAADRYTKSAVDIIGDSTLMMTGDYPHQETSFERTRQRMRSKGLSDESLRRVCVDNAKRAYPRL